MCLRILCETCVGVCQVCGSHKSNFSTPSAMWSLSSEALTPYVTEVHARKGDAVLFCE